MRAKILDYNILRYLMPLTTSRRVTSDWPARQVGRENDAPASLLRLGAPEAS